MGNKHGKRRDDGVKGNVMDLSNRLLDASQTTRREMTATWFRKEIAVTDVYEILETIGNGHMGEVYKVQRKNATRGLHNDITRNKKHTISTNTSAGASSGVGAKTKTSTSKKSGGKTAASSKDRPATAPGTVNRPSNSKMTASNNNSINMSGNSKDDSNLTNSTKTKIVTPPKPILRSSSYGNFSELPQLTPLHYTAQAIFMPLLLLSPQHLLLLAMPWTPLKQSNWRPISTSLCI